ncbi:MAG: lysophospholipid acyltransferase family protein [Alphaproteobacteria bacterium]
MIFCRNLCFQILFFLWNFILAIVFLWVLLLPRRCLFALVGIYLGGISFLMRAVAGVSFRVLGQENLPAAPCIIAAKHLAPWETMILPRLGKSPAIVLKRELMWLPLWGWYAWKYGNVPVDRGAGAKAMRKMIHAARGVIKDGRDLMIFPQGTRLEPGEWKPYKTGVAALYQALGAPVLPVALNSGIYWSRGGKLKRTGTVTIEFLPVIPPGLPRAEMMRQLQDAIETATNRLVVAEGGMAVPAPDQTTAIAH